MNFATVSKTLVLASALVLASTAFAATKGSLQISSPVVVNGTQLKPGEYKLQWEGTGNVEVSIMQGKSVVAKVPARVVDLAQAAPNDAAVTRSNESGAKTLAGVRFGGKKTALELGEASDSMQAGGSSK